MMHPTQRVLSVVFLVLCVVGAIPVSAESPVSSSTGFRIVATDNVPMAPGDAYETFVRDFSKWYDASHSYTQKAENLSLDMDKSCMLEKMPHGGFVRHMEIVFHQPGKMLRMTGGMGPLQGMGVSGALTYEFKELEPSDKNAGKKTKVTMTYSVSGAEHLQLDQLADVVNQVLKSQLTRYRIHCEKTQ